MPTVLDLQGTKASIGWFTFFNCRGGHFQKILLEYLLAGHPYRFFEAGDNGGDSHTQFFGVFTNYTIAPNTDPYTRALIVTLKSPFSGKSTVQISPITGISPRTIDSIYGRAF